MTTENTHIHGDIFYPELFSYLQARLAEFEWIPTERKHDLGVVAKYIVDRRSPSVPAELIFVCTHNSRRSHLSQIWAQVASDYYHLSGVATHSGGTEATAFNPRAVATLRRCGFEITAADPDTSNPRYEVRHREDAVPQLCFSKVYSDAPNPTSDYCAVMTCAQADEACPLVMGCELRMPIRYNDPKVADDTDREATAYDERSRQICREMLFLMSQVRQA